MQLFNRYYSSGGHQANPSIASPAFAMASKAMLKEVFVPIVLTVAYIVTTNFLFLPSRPKGTYVF